MVDRVSSLEEGAAVIAEGATYALFCYSYQDSPTGEWFIYIDVVCRDSKAAGRIVEKTKDWISEDPIGGCPVLGHAYSFPLSGGSVFQRSGNLTQSQQEELGQMVEARAEITKVWLNQLAAEL